VRFVLDKPIQRRWFFGKSTPTTITAEHRTIDKNTRLMLLSIAFIVVLVYIRYASAVLSKYRNGLSRTMYRTIELTDGWGGPIIRNETYFNVLDGGAICLAMFALNFLHPGFLVSSRPLKADLESKDSSAAKIGKA